jgi:hypothetical protein
MASTRRERGKPIVPFKRDLVEEGRACVRRIDPDR